MEQTERQKILAGQLYDPREPELVRAACVRETFATS